MPSGRSVASQFQRPISNSKGDIYLWLKFLTYVYFYKCLVAISLTNDQWKRFDAICTLWKAWKTCVKSPTRIRPERGGLWGKPSQTSDTYSYKTRQLSKGLVACGLIHCNPPGTYIMYVISVKTDFICVI